MVERALRISRKLMLRLVLVAVFLGAATVLRRAGSEPGFPRYRLVNLGHLLGRNATFPRPSTTGDRWLATPTRMSPPGHLGSMLASPFLWENGRMRELKTLGGEFGHAYDINDAGDVVGSAEDKEATRPVIWKRNRGCGGAASAVTRPSCVPPA